MPLNEEETKIRLVEPKLKAARWTDSQIAREYYYHRNVRYTHGRIFLVGEDARRREPRRVDYVLRYTDSFIIAVVEAEPESRSSDAGLEQAKDYARDLDVPFAYATNGHGIVEYDFFTHSSRTLQQFPTPDELWNRWVENTHSTDLALAAEIRAEYLAGLQAKWRDPLLHPYCPERLCGKQPFYFQEVAIRRILERIMRGQERVLLNMATGTGKTFVAFQIVWKLIKSGWLQRRHLDRPARVLYLADRIFLRNQAYNTFAPFAQERSGDPRHLIEGHPPNLNRDLYFGIYQTLWSEDENGVRLFQKFPRDFFDLVIIDECHRSGFGTWREILDHFASAIHFGMTATPKQDENIDTYAYFCAEEPEVAIDPENPSKGKWRPPAYRYSMGRGIEDGFLAPYKIHRIYTTVDQTGLHLREAAEQGAEIFVPEGAEPKEIYHTPEFEREITLPDRTQTMVQHLASLLRRFDPMEKTIIFCVDTEHARLVARLLQNEFADLGYDNYAVPIVAEEGSRAEQWLEDFADSDKRTPVVATTVDLLTTGVDVPSCRNIVFMRTVASPIVFKQIIGRGSRLDEATGKLWFRIIDYTGATRLIDQWDLPPAPPTMPQGPFTAAIEGIVVHAQTGDLLVRASVRVHVGPNIQQGPALTDENGAFQFTNLPAGRIVLIASAPGFRHKEMKVATEADTVTTVVLELKPDTGPVQKIRVEGLEVQIAEETVFVVEATGEQLSLDEFRDYTRRVVTTRAQAEGTLRAIWVNPQQRERFLTGLRQQGIHPSLLAELLGVPDADTFDLLAHIAFGSPIRTRSERATAFLNRQQAFLSRFGEDARRVILAMLEKYRLYGLEEISHHEIFNLSPFRDWGGVSKIQRWFGDISAMRQALTEMQKRLYAEV